MTQCNTKTRLDFHPKFPVDIEFSAPDISSDGGLLLLRQAEDSIGVCEMLAGLVPDGRDATRIRHHRVEQMEQRVFQICMGYEDCNDANWLRKSPLWKTVMGLTPESEEGLSSQPTLSRFENSVDEQTVEVMHFALMADFVRRLPEDIECLVLDLDSSAVEGFGEQQELFYNGFHDAHIFHPLMIIDGESGQLITAMLRPGNVGDARDADKVLEKLIVLIKVLRPNCAVCVRADAGFASPALYDCLEFFDDLYGGVYYLFGISKNSRLKTELSALTESVREHDPGGNRPLRQFTTFDYQAGSWPHERMIAGKAERTGDKDNPRFLVTNLTGFSGRVLYEAYCMRANCELRIDELKHHLAGHKLSCTNFIANSFRLLLNVAAYRLMWQIQRTLKELAAQQKANAPLRRKLTALCRARFDTIRLRLLKVGFLIKQSARRVFIQGSQTFPQADVFCKMLATPPP